LPPPQSRLRSLIDDYLERSGIPQLRIVAETVATDILAGLLAHGRIAAFVPKRLGEESCRQGLVRLPPGIHTDISMPVSVCTANPPGMAEEAVIEAIRASVRRDRALRAGAAGR